MEEQRPESIRTFALLRKLSEGKMLPPEETHELLENQYNMAGLNVITKIEAQNAKLDAFAEFMNARQESMNARQESMNARHDALTESMKARHDALTESMNARLDMLVESMNRQHSTFLWVIGIATALLGTIQIFT